MNNTHLVKALMENTLNLNEFFVEGENQELSHVLLHIIQPSTPEEEKEKGYFFAACEINNGGKEDVLNLQALMDRIENDYYSSEIDKILIHFNEYYIQFAGIVRNKE